MNPMRVVPVDEAEAVKQAMKMAIEAGHTPVIDEQSPIGARLKCLACGAYGRVVRGETRKVRYIRYGKIFDECLIQGSQKEASHE